MEKKKLSTISIKNEEINKNDTTYILEASYNDPEELSKNVFDKKNKKQEKFIIKLQEEVNQILN